MEALILSTLLLIVDWGQTREISANPKYFEGNIALSENPSTRNVDLYFGSVLVGNAIVGYALPPKMRKKYWNGVAIFEAGIVTQNLNTFNIKMNWRF